MVEGGAREQTAQIMQNLDAIFTAAGCSRTDVAKVTVFVTDLDAHYGDVNKVYAEVSTSNDTCVLYHTGRER